MKKKLHINHIVYIISEDNYIGKYCTCCGKKIAIPVVQHSYNYKSKGELPYAN